MKLKFTTISPIILSPRMEKALYKGVDFKEIDGKSKNFKLKNVDSINIVYPFYSYEDRDLLSEKNFSFVNNYYIPASSLKGGLFVGKKCEDDNMLRIKSVFRDISISKDYIELKNLYKFQYLYQKAGEIDTVGKDKDKQDLVYKTPNFEPFFPGVAIEMIGTGKKFESDILLKPGISEELFKNKLDESFSITKIKLENYINEIELRITDINEWIKNGNLKQEEGKKEDFLSQLEEIKEKIKSLIDRKLLFLGGYKGILGSLTRKLDEIQKVKNGFYIDEETMLPYGLVEVFYEVKNKE